MIADSKNRIEEARAKAKALQAKHFQLPGTGGPIIPINFHDYDIIIINSSGGKDSSVAVWEINRIAEQQDYPKSKIHVSHQDLSETEWSGTEELARKQAGMFGFQFHVSKVRKDGKVGPEGNDTILERTRRKHQQNLKDFASGEKDEIAPPWPDNNNRWCTSDFKTGPGSRVVTMLTKDIERPQVLYVFGFRAQESSNRKKKPIIERNKKLSSKDKKDPGKKVVTNFLPVHDWLEERVWQVIKENNIPYHEAYDLGMPRLSCCFCIYGSFDAFVVAGKANPKLLDEYIKVEDETGFAFKIDGTRLSDVKKAIKEGYDPIKETGSIEWDSRM